MTSTALVRTSTTPLLPTVDAQAPVQQQLSATRRIAEWHQAELETITAGARGFGDDLLQKLGRHIDRSGLASDATSRHLWQLAPLAGFVAGAAAIVFAEPSLATAGLVAVVTGAAVALTPLVAKGLRAIADSANRRRPEVSDAAVAPAVQGYEGSTGLTRAVRGRLLEDWRTIMQQRHAQSPMAQHSLDEVVRELSGKPDEPRAVALADLAKTIIDTTPVTAETVATIDRQLTRFSASNNEQLELGKAVGEMIDASGRAVSDGVQGKLVDLSFPKSERLG